VFQPDYGRAALVYQLLRDYHDTVAPALKQLRAHKDVRSDVLLDWNEIEINRVRATGWFNHVFALYSNGLIALEDFGIVASVRAAQLWVAFVLPLDVEIRKAAHGPDVEGYSNPVADFWTDYAAGQLRIYGPKTDAVS